MKTEPTARDAERYIRRMRYATAAGRVIGHMLFWGVVILVITGAAAIIGTILRGLL